MECDVFAAAVWFMIFVIAVVALYFQYKLRLAEIKKEKHKRKKKWFSGLLWGCYIAVIGVAFALFGKDPDLLWVLFVIGAGIVIVLTSIAERAGLE
jgi:lipoprotein signal peptidase